jgi:Mlc titration factor MtfA (ptsG expression regulator)
VLFSLLRRRRRRRLLATPFPRDWEPIVEGIPVCAGLVGEDRRRHRDVLRVIATERNFEGCGGLALTEWMRVVVAAQAALLLLGLEHDYFSSVSSVLLYPSTVVSPWPSVAGGIWSVGRPVDGEASPYGPVILAWDRVEDEARSTESGRNVVLHEFAHRLDAENGDVDGVPHLGRRVAIGRWASVLRPEFEALAANQSYSGVLDDYGATNPGEFFAVAIEVFFTRPHALRAHHPDLHAVLAAYLGQDPAERREFSL